ncbi:AI-2E family transporter [Chromobacterium phragmitis]|uniref:AI-2E family transporter n=1 Tax=Chromobacterium phragmitis TaxID=2202141 RepID=A0A344UD46_9NEIS|nr:AI-2E family transporter [Chromobacterium phragmitis]AXE31813.1 AI-2E family transporter [Chromobacterium phragmitis]AXE33194.1 AI-2E family transporter [Chromobacterium phragmitis]
MPVVNGFPNLSILSVFRVAILALLVVSCLKVLQPFLGALTWAAIIAISAWPLYGRLRERLRGRHKLAALLIVLALGAALAIPIGLMALTLADTLPHLNSLGHDLAGLSLPSAPAWLANLPLVGDSLQKLWQSTQADLPGLFEKIRPAVNQTALWLLSGGANLSISLLEIVLAIVVAGLLLINGDKLWDLVERIVVKLGGETAGELPEVIARTIRSVTTGVVGTALAQTILCVIGLLIAGVPGALVLGFLCFIVAVAQMPTLVVWLPAAGWVFYTGHTGLGVFLLVWGFLLINTIDNILKPLLISQGAQMPLSVIFLGVIGGLIAWGVIGLFIGPTLLAVSLTMLRHWLQREDNEELACEGEQN